MRAPKVKVCGITRLEDAVAACEAGVDVLGFNFAPEARKRDRYIEPDDARAIIDQLPPFVITAAICVNEPTDRLIEFLGFVDYVQLHGEETVEQCRAVASRAIKSFRVGSSFDPDTMLSYPARLYLLDACVPGSRCDSAKSALKTVTSISGRIKFVNLSIPRSGRLS